MIDELSPEARAVIAAGLRAERPTAADRARVRAALDARLAAESSRVLPRTASLGLGVAVLALVALGVWWLARRVPAPPPRPRTAPSVVAPGGPCAVGALRADGASYAACGPVRACADDCARHAPADGARARIRTTPTRSRRRCGCWASPAAPGPTATTRTPCARCPSTVDGFRGVRSPRSARRPSCSCDVGVGTQTPRRGWRPSCGDSRRLRNDRGSSAPARRGPSDARGGDGAALVRLRSRGLVGQRHRL